MLHRLMLTASSTMVPMYTATPATKKLARGKGPRVSASAPRHVATIEPTCAATRLWCVPARPRRHATP